MVTSSEGKSCVVEQTSSAIVGGTLEEVREEVREDVRQGDLTMMAQQVHQGALDREKADAVTPEVFWKCLPG